jgi:Golgi SNAP receptor complex protein 1
MKPAASTQREAGKQEWDQLRREARKLETELDVRLAAFGKLCASFDTTYGTRGEAGLATDQLTHTKAAEIEEYLRKLSDVNGRLAACLSVANDTRSPMLTRHRDILHDYTQEFRRLTATLGEARDRANLFTGSSESAPLAGQATGALLLRERSNITNSNAAMDDVMGQAQEVAFNLREQRQLFSNIGDKLLSVAAKYPAVSGLLNAIRRKRSKDTLILSGVIAVCSLFTLLYWWNKR